MPGAKRTSPVVVSPDHAHEYTAQGFLIIRHRPGPPLGRGFSVTVTVPSIDRIRSCISFGDDDVTDCAAVRARYPDFAGHLAAGENEALSAALRRAESVGRPLGDAAVLQRLEEIAGRSLMRGKRGPKPKSE